MHRRGPDACRWSRTRHLARVAPRRQGSGWRQRRWTRVLACSRVEEATLVKLGEGLMESLIIPASSGGSSRRCQKSLMGRSLPRCSRLPL